MKPLLASNVATSVIHAQQRPQTAFLARSAETGQTSRVLNVPVLMVSSTRVLSPVLLVIGDATHVKHLCTIASHARAQIGM